MKAFRVRTTKPCLAYTVAAALLCPAAAFAQDNSLNNTSAQQAETGPVQGDQSDTSGPPPKKRVSLAQAVGLPGVIPRLDLTGFVQSQVTGDGAKDARFTGRGDLFVDFSSDGLGLWNGTLLRTHTEVRASDSDASRFGGGLWPQNTAAILPLTGEGIELTSLYVVQKLSDRTNLIAGKINMIDLLASDPFFGGWGTKRFQNLAFVAPPSGVVPPTIMGGMLTHQVGDVTLTVMVFDPEDRSGDYWIDDLFQTGVNGSIGATWRGTVGGRATTLGVTASGSTSEGIDFADILAPPDLVGGTREGSYNIAVQFGHDLLGDAKPKQVWKIRFWLEREGRVRDRALFDLAIDSKLRGCDLVSIKTGDLTNGPEIKHRAMVVQRKTKKPVQFELMSTARQSLLDWLEERGGSVDEYAFPSRIDNSRHLSTRQYARLVDEWVSAIGLRPRDYGTHSLRRTKAALIYKRTGNLRAVQILLGHTKIETTVRYLGVDIEDALELAEATEV